MERRVYWQIGLIFQSFAAQTGIPSTAPNGLLRNRPFGGGHRTSLALEYSTMSTQSLSFAVRGMREECPRSAVEIERVLTQLDGVIAAQVNYATEQARVVYDPSRVTGLKLVSAIRSIAFDTPLEHLTLRSGDLLYATSARTVERLLQAAAGVVHVTADVAAMTLHVEAFPQSHHAQPLEDAMEGLGLSVDQAGSANARALFLFRLLILAAIELLALWSAGAHAGILLAPGSLHAPLVVVIVSLVALFGAGWPFYRFAFDAALHGEFDAGVMVALFAMLSALGGLPVGILLPSPWWIDLGFLISTTLTVAWFLYRAISLWPSFPRVKNAARYFPIAAGSVGVFVMLGVYLGILSLLQSPSHAVEQFVADGIWVALVALGFGAQMGLYAYLRAMLHAAKAAGATAVTGVGTGTSTLGMLACCAHHLTDLAPLVAFMGASGLSGVIGFLTEWKYGFIGIGLAVNMVGIFVTLRTIRQSQSHLRTLTDTIELQATPACH